MIYSIMERDSFIISNGFHTENVLMVVLDGSFELVINEKRFIADKNSVLFFEKGKIFTRKIISPVKFIYIITDFDIRIETGVLNFLDTARKDSTVVFLTDAVNSRNNQNVRHFSNDLIMQFLIENHNEKSAYSDEILKFFEYVDKNHSKKIKIQEFSEKIYMSHTGFLLKFKKEVGTTPSEYISSFRLEKSVDLLINTNYSIGKIAEEVGYENLYYFSNAFKKKYNMSPSDFRKNKI